MIKHLAGVSNCRTYPLDGVRQMFYAIAPRKQFQYHNQSHNPSRNPSCNPSRKTTFNLPLGRIVMGSCLCLGLLGCNTTQTNSTSENQDSQILQVVATSTIIADLAAQIGAEEIALTGLLQPGADPHIYEPVSQDSRSIEEADLILYNGYNLEPALIKLIQASGIKAEKLAVAEVVPPLDFAYQDQRQPDPHVWGNVENAIEMTKAIRDILIKLSPEDEEIFDQNADRLISNLQHLHIWVSEQITTIPPSQRKLVTTHDAFQYYADAYGLEIVGTLIGMSTEEQPSAQTVARLVEAVRIANVPGIFAETTINPKLIQTVATEANVQLAPQELYSDSIGANGSEADSYLKMIVINTQTIVQTLGGEIQSFQVKHW